MLLKLTFDDKARIVRVEPVRASDPKLESAALQAVNLWRFSQPAEKDGVAIGIKLFQLITFEIEGRAKAAWQWQVTPEPALHEYTVTTNVPVR